jgi:hypothetical protein
VGVGWEGAAGGACHVTWRVCAGEEGQSREASRCCCGRCSHSAPAPGQPQGPLRGLRSGSQGGGGGGGCCNRDLGRTQPSGGRRAEAEAEQGQESLLSQREAHLELWYQRQPGGRERLEKSSGSWEEPARLEGGLLRPRAQSRAQPGAKPRVFSGSQSHARQFEVPGILVRSASQRRVLEAKATSSAFRSPPRPSLAGTTGLPDRAARSDREPHPKGGSRRELGSGAALPRLCRGRRPSGVERTAEGT